MYYHYHLFPDANLNAALAARAEVPRGDGGVAVLVGEGILGDDGSVSVVQHGLLDAFFLFPRLFQLAFRAAVHERRHHHGVLLPFGQRLEGLLDEAHLRLALVLPVPLLQLGLLARQDVSGNLGGRSQEQLREKI